jgi:hypothetical protein
MASASNGASAEGYASRPAAVGRQAASADSNACVAIVPRHRASQDEVCACHAQLLVCTYIYMYLYIYILYICIYICMYVFVCMYIYHNYIRRTHIISLGENQQVEYTREPNGQALYY